MVQMKWIFDLLLAGLLFSIGGGIMAGLWDSHWIVAATGLLPIALAIFIIKRRYRLS